MRPTPTADEIRTAYRLLLDREPDEAGMAFYGRLAEAGQLDFARLREILLASEEYRLRFRHRRVTVELRGAKLVVDAEDPAFGAGLAGGAPHDPLVAAVLHRLLRPAAVYVDIGANIGALALPAALRVGPRGKVIGFEPDPANASLFLAGVAANGFSQVRLFPLALSDAPGVFALQGASNAYLVPPGETDVMVQAMPGDELLAAEPRIDVVKLDIEGHEPRALAGLARTLARHRPWIVLEFNPRCLRDHGGTTPERFAEQLFALTPRVQVLHPEKEVLADTPADLLAAWRAANAQAVTEGGLPDGMAHLDLVFRVGCAPKG